MRNVERTRIVVPGAVMREGRRRPGTLAALRCVTMPPDEEGLDAVTIAVDAVAVGAGIGVELPAPPPPVPLAAGVTATDADDAFEVPTAFVAVTVKVYAVPFVSPVTVMGLAAPVAVMPPGELVTRYEVIAEPPFAGAVKRTVAAPSPAAAVTPLGALGATAV